MGLLAVSLLKYINQALKPTRVTVCQNIRSNYKETSKQWFDDMYQIMSEAIHFILSDNLEFPLSLSLVHAYFSSPQMIPG